MSVITLVFFIFLTMIIIMVVYQQTVVRRREELRKLKNAKQRMDIQLSDLRKQAKSLQQDEVLLKRQVLALESMQTNGPATPADVATPQEEDFDPFAPPDLE